MTKHERAYFAFSILSALTAVIMFVLPSIAYSDNNLHRDNYLSFSGIYPHLAVSNGSRGECGIGAVVNWDNYLWYVTYQGHKPFGSNDKLYQLAPDLKLTIRPESIGGTPANRMIHKETKQLIIASYLISKDGKVRTVPFSKMPGRMTACARDLTDPAHKVYFITMEEGIYEVDVNTLKVKTLHKDRNAGGTDLLPGNHGKGGYTGQGRLVVSNNGQGGVLAEWDGTGNPGKPGSWKIIDRNKYTEITSKGGIYGAPDNKTPLWALGWDNKSVLLNVCDNGGKWKRFRLPKADYTYDADCGWYTEWPRIRQIKKGFYLMNMHGMFYRFPGNFSHTHTAGIRPISQHLKMVVDYTRFNGRIVMACDDASTFDNPLTGRDDSNLWFFNSIRDLKNLGNPAGVGGPWVNEQVKANVPSEPFLYAGFAKKMVHICHDSSQPVKFDFELDKNGNGNWQHYVTVTVPAHGYAYYVFPADIQAEWIRVKANRNIKSATVYFYYNSPAVKPAPVMFTSLTRAYHTDTAATISISDVPEITTAGTIHTGRSEGILYPLSTGNIKLAFAASALDKNGNIIAKGYYEIGADMKLRPAKTSKTSWLNKHAGIKQQFKIDNASVIITSKQGKHYRLPLGPNILQKPDALGWYRSVREVVTERSLMNICGTFYELPRDDAGGMARIRPITTHNRMIYDFCSWRGMLVLSGNNLTALPSNHYIPSTDGKVGLWFGCVDDLWKLGKPRGHGGPWCNTPVKPNTPSDPYLMYGYDKKKLILSHNSKHPVKFTLEVDFLGNGTWNQYKTISVSPGQKLTYYFPAGYQAHWIRLKSNTPCRVTATFIYE